MARQLNDIKVKYMNIDADELTIHSLFNRGDFVFRVPTYQRPYDWGSDQWSDLWDDVITRSLADFQKVAVRQAIQMIRDHGGVFVSDVVGLGKSYIGAGVVKHFERIERIRLYENNIF